MPKDEIIKSFPLKLENTRVLIIISIKYCIDKALVEDKELKDWIRTKLSLTVDTMVIYIDNTVNLHINCISIHLTSTFLRYYLYQ